MQLKITAVSDKGCVREHNEDMILIGNDIFRDGRKEILIDLNEENKIFFVAIADGMGGHNAGEVASEMVLRKINRKIINLETGLTEKELNLKISEWVKEIHANILLEGNKDIDKKGMGSTLIGALFYNNKIYFLNVGDSRLYRLRNGFLMQISRDHSLREIMGNEDIASNIITNSFGGDEKIFVDFDSAGSKIFNEDAFLLCSDGLSDELNDEEIEETLEDKKNAVDELLKKTKNKGGKDNISIILVYFSGVENENNG